MGFTSKIILVVVASFGVTVLISTSISFNNTYLKKKDIAIEEEMDDQELLSEMPIGFSTELPADGVEVTPPGN